MGYLIQVPPNPLEWVAENNSVVNDCVYIFS
jgi:hypothetical protein